MGMIGHKRPGINAALRIDSKPSQTIGKIFAVGDIVDNPPFFDPPHYHMMKSPAGIQSRTTRHRFLLLSLFLNL